MEFYEILAFSDNAKNGEVYIILATGLSDEDVAKIDFSVTRFGNQIKVILHSQNNEVHMGTPDTPEVFNWTKAALGCMDNDLKLHYTTMVDIKE